MLERTRSWRLSSSDAPVREPALLRMQGLSFEPYGEGNGRSIPNRDEDERLTAGQRARSFL